MIHLRHFYNAQGPSESGSAKSLLVEIPESIVKDGRIFGASSGSYLRDALNEYPQPCSKPNLTQRSLKRGNEDAFRGILTNRFH